MLRVNQGYTDIVKQSDFYKQLEIKLKSYMDEEQFENIIFDELEVYQLHSGDIVIDEEAPPEVYTFIMEGQIL
jgi:hypothetical protein